MFVAVSAPGQDGLFAHHWLSCSTESKKETSAYAHRNLTKDRGAVTNFARLASQVNLEYVSYKLGAHTFSTQMPQRIKNTVLPVSFISIVSA